MKKHSGRLQEIINTAKALGWWYDESGNEEFTDYNGEYGITYGLYYNAPTGIGDWCIPFCIEVKRIPENAGRNIDFSILYEIMRESSEHNSLRRMLFYAADTSEAFNFFEGDDPQKAIQDYCSGTATALWNGQQAFEELCSALKEKHLML